MQVPGSIKCVLRWAEALPKCHHSYVLKQLLCNLKKGMLALLSWISFELRKGMWDRPSALARNTSAKLDLQLCILRPFTLHVCKGKTMQHRAPRSLQAPVDVSVSL